uniref:(northern house mosquito) hypothetical protein n=1 Tax=Culex pipiens TaxID=7175 RepID=A0A8D8BK85_CULPI
MGAAFNSCVSRHERRRRFSVPFCHRWRRRSERATLNTQMWPQKVHVRLDLGWVVRLPKFDELGIFHAEPPPVGLGVSAGHTQDFGNFFPRLKLIGAHRFVDVKRRILLH